MKILFSCCLFFTIFFTAKAQTYVMLAPSITNTAGTLSDKMNMAIELGRQWDAFSAGIDFGKTTLSKKNIKDTSLYIEFRPNLNVFQQGKFTNTLTTGIGYIFNAQLNLVTELTSGIEYAFTPQIHFNTYFGQYYYSGKFSTDNTTFFGISVMYYFNKSTTKGLLNLKKN